MLTITNDDVQFLRMVLNCADADLEGAVKRRIPADDLAAARKTRREIAAALKFLSADETSDDFGHEDDPLDLAQRLAYMSGGKCCCPWCGGRHVEGNGEHSMDADWYENEIVCLDCGAVWRDLYAITDVRGVQSPTKSKPKPPRRKDP